MKLMKLLYHVTWLCKHDSMIPTLRQRWNHYIIRPCPQDDAMNASLQQRWIQS